MKVVYVCGPYKANSHTSKEENIRNAEAAAIQLWDAGLGAFCPHLNSANFDDKCSASPQDFLEFDLIMLPSCDILLALPGWEESEGSRVETSRAMDIGIPVYFSIKDLMQGEK